MNKDLIKRKPSLILVSSHLVIFAISSSSFFRHYSIQSTDIRTHMISGPVGPRSDITPKSGFFVLSF